MARSPCKSISTTISADKDFDLDPFGGSKNNKSKKGMSAPGEIVPRLAKMSLTSQADVKNKANKRKKKKDKLAKKNELNNKKKVNEALPFVVYEFVKEAVDIMNRPGLPDDIDRAELEIAEYKIALACRVCSDDLPLCWKYERDQARSLIAGYGKVFVDSRNDKYVM